VEHLTSLRLIPNLAVFRPADVVETAEAWMLALERRDGPSVLALSRQNLPQVRLERSENLSARGAYRLRAASAARRVVLIATGSEVELALTVADALEGHGIACRSRRERRSAGSATSGRTASPSALTGSAPPRLPKTFSNASVSPPKQSCRASSRP
jgi:hypothetical protein